MYVYIYIHIHIYISIYTCICMYILVHEYMNIFIYMYINVHKYTRIYTYIYVHVFIHRNGYIYICIYIYVYIHIYIYICIYTRLVPHPYEQSSKQEDRGVCSAISPCMGGYEPTYFCVTSRKAILDKTRELAKWLPTVIHFPLQCMGTHSRQDSRARRVASQEANSAVCCLHLC